MNSTNFLSDEQLSTSPTNNLMQRPGKQNPTTLSICQVYQEMNGI